LYWDVSGVGTGVVLRGYLGDFTGVPVIFSIFTVVR